MTMDDAVRAGAADSPVSVLEAAALFADVSGTPALVLAVSGGPDSTALMWLAARWRARRKCGPRLIAVTVDHGLRKESAREALMVKRLAKKLKVEHRTLRWTGKKPKTGIQEAARWARYRLLADTARKAGARHVLTAHTLDDQAETVLFRMARGSGIAGLRGMGRHTPLSFRGAAQRRARNPYPRAAVLDSGLTPSACPGMTNLLLVRPFLSIPKSRLIATLAAAKIPFADDSSNRDPRFARPRLRDLMPGLAAEGLDARRLAALARRMARADQAIEAAVDDAEARLSRDAGGAIVLSSRYADLPAEVALRLLGRAVARSGNEGPVELGKLEDLFEGIMVSWNPDLPRAFRRTLAGAMVTLAGTKLIVERAPPRRPARKPRKSQRKARFTTAS
jgi:tRNA(Ile)-lysidine synthase